MYERKTATVTSQREMMFSVHTKDIEEGWQLSVRSAKETVKVVRNTNVVFTFISQRKLFNYVFI
jgi:hypothetical protein